MLNSLILILLLNFISANSEDQAFPYSVELKTVNGKTINSSSFSSENKYVFVEFWFTGCGPCSQWFDTVKNNFDEWNSKTNCKIIAVACQKRDYNALRFIEAKKWPFGIYFDPEFKLFSRLNGLFESNEIQFVFPTTFVFDRNWNLKKNT